MQIFLGKREREREKKQILRKIYRMHILRKVIKFGMITLNMLKYMYEQV